RKYVGVSMIQHMEDMIKVGIALGFNIEGCQHMLEKMIADMGDEIEINMLRVDLWTLRRKDRIISSDNYVAIQGNWVQNGLKIMFVAVYAPQGLGSKIALWLTLSQLISNWDSHALVMGDFNKVREVGERSGTILGKGIPDHRPILLKEFVVDYGPTLFRFFHSWLDREGFYDLVVDTWKYYDSGKSNDMISFKNKL
ncbi:RNA-directed DNA polymerase, eukaryota, reverse transcriptase zinc-binding domain protein, partial [Tanacetum coccineum]